MGDGDDISETATGACVVCGQDYQYRIQASPQWYWCRECVRAYGGSDSPRRRMVERHLAMSRAVDAADARIQALREALQFYADENIDDPPNAALNALRIDDEAAR
jgi:LPS O-antigen subunit length determinant protein (WzzB/FepE family)